MEIKTSSVFMLLMLFLGAVGFAQQKMVTGTVTDENSVPLPGVNVIIEGTSQGTNTDFDGKYSLEASEGDRLQFSRVGFKDQKITVGTSSIVNVMMEEGTALDEVVVTAMGITREKKSLGYSVQEVKSEELTKTPQTNLLNALSGKIAGAQITSMGGAPGQGSSIVIRGINSIDPNANNQPLFIVDGVPISNDTYTAGGGSLTGVTNRSSDIDLEDVESLSVLKGGAATALYGVRAANGAVIITTKKGRDGKTTFNLTASTSYDEVDKYPKMQEKYTQGWAGVYDDGFWPNFGPTVEEARKIDPDHPKTLYNNFRNAYQSGYTNKLHFSASGGSDKATFYTAYSRQDQKGIIPNTDYVRTGAKISGDLKFSERFKVFGSVDYINSGGNKVNANSFNERLIYWAPQYDVNDDEFTEGPLAGTQKGYYNNFHSGNNPVYLTKANKFKDDVDRFFGNIGFNFTPIDNLDINYRFGLDYYSDKRTGTGQGPTGVENENTANSEGYINETRILSKDLTSNLMASYNKQLSNKFDLTLRAGFDIFQRQFDLITASGEDLDVYNLYHLSNAKIISTKQSFTRTRTVGVYGEVSLSYDDFLYLTLTDRNDWASTLPRKNRSFNYPSVSLGYVFTDNFDIPNWFSYGKLRASWAQIGKDAVSAYLTSDTYTATAANFPVNGVTGWTRPGNKADPDLRSELTQEIEFGVEFKFFSNRFGLDISWYRSNAKDQILRVPISETSGYSTFTTNAGEIQNSGFEIMLNASPIETQDFSWDLYLNFSNNKNKVVQIRDGIESVFVMSQSGMPNAGASQRLFVGEPYGTIMGTSIARYYENSADEDPLYVDKDRPYLIGDDGFPVKNFDQKIIGNSTPDWMMNIGSTFRYKDLSLSFNFDFRQGYKKFDNLDNFMAGFGQATYTLNRDDFIVFDGYLADGTKNTKEVWLGQGIGPDGVDYGNGYYRDNYRQLTENFVRDASWVRLKDLSLTYNLPKHWIQKLSMTNANLTMSGHNLWLSTKYRSFDPEATSSTSANASAFGGLSAFPSLRSYALTLRLTF